MPAACRSSAKRKIYCILTMKFLLMKTMNLLKNIMTLTVAVIASPWLIFLYVLLAMLMALLEKLARLLQKALDVYFRLMEGLKTCFI